MSVALRAIALLLVASVASAGVTLGPGITVGEGVTFGSGTGGQQAASAPDISALAVATPTNAHRVCQDTDSDGDCEGFKFSLKPPMDTSGWTVSALGTNPTFSAVATELNSDDGGCEVVTFDGTLTVNNNDEVGIAPPNGCVVLRGLGASPNPITIQAGATPNNSCTGSASNDLPAYFVPCGSRGSTQSWTAGYDLNDTVITVADVSQFGLYTSAAPWTDNAYVQVMSDASNSACPTHFPRQTGTPGRRGNDRMHRVMAIVDSDGAGPGTAGTLTIDPPLMLDYDDDLPDCGNFQVRPATLPVVGFENVDFSTVDGDEGCTFPAIDSITGCTFARIPFIVYRYAQGWVTDSKFHDAITDMVTLRFASDVYMEGLEIYNPTSGFTDVQFQATFIRFGEGTTRSGIVHSYIHDLEQPIQFREGGGLNVVAHILEEGVRRSGIHFHGLRSGPNLVEGSELMGFVSDRTWSPLGPYNVTYRNNAIAGTAPSNTAGFGRFHDGPGIQMGPTPASPTTSQGTGYGWTHIGDRGDVFTGYLQDPFRWFDDHNTPDAYAEYLWATSTGAWYFPDGTTRTDAFGTYEVDCDTCTDSNLSVSASQPSGWDAIGAPETLFEFEGRTAAWPPYWCQEGADFFDVSNSIGAFSATQQTLPAERVIKDGLGCTACGSGGSGC